MRLLNLLVGGSLILSVVTLAPGAVNVDFENYSLGAVSGASPDPWNFISGGTFQVTDVDPIAGTKSLNLVGSGSGQSRSTLEFADISGLIHAEYRVRPGADSNSAPLVYLQLNNSVGYGAVGVYFHMWSGSPLFGYYVGGDFTSIANGYVRGNDHLVSIDLDTATDTYDMTVTDLTASQTVVSVTGIDFRAVANTNIAEIAYLDIYVDNNASETLIDNINIGVVPEPASLALLGLMTCFAIRRRA